MVKNQPATTVLSKCRSRSGSVKRCLLAAVIACHLASHADDDVDAVRTEGKETRRATEQRYEARVVERFDQDSFTRLDCVCVCFLPIHSGHQVVLTVCRTTVLNTRERPPHFIFLYLILG